jgi:ABC-type antimicrobial peptide transport system permease subunit
VIAFGVTRRSRELGVRIALDARANDVVRMLVIDGVRLTTFGATFGLAIAWVASKSIGDQFR